MTTRHAGYVVILDDAIREDDAAATVAALRQIKGVATVEPIEASPAIQVAYGQARAALEALLWRALREPRR